uniref:Uncharacterized protein n=1 Tax=Anguilla anguilla TaxID=7936 RepID=A0A0E9TZZ9_ANGAN
MCKEAFCRSFIHFMCLKTFFFEMTK